MTYTATGRPFRFGVSIRGASTPKEWRHKARQAEAAGFDTLLTADHLVDGMLAPLTSLVVAAEATARIRIGTLTPIPRRARSYCNTISQTISTHASGGLAAATGP